MPSFNLKCANSYLDGQTMIEQFPRAKLVALLKHSHFPDCFVDETNPDSEWAKKMNATFKKGPRQQLEKYLEKYDKTIGGVSCLYGKSSKNKWGRVYPIDSNGLTSMSREVRNYLIEGIYYDFDLECAHQSMLNELCRFDDSLNCEFLAEYCEDREYVLNRIADLYQTDRDKTKLLFNTLCYGGSFEGWAKRNDIKLGMVDRFIDGFKEDLQPIIDKCIKGCPTLWERIRKQGDHPDNKWSVAQRRRSFLGLYNQELELQIVDSVVRTIHTTTNLMKGDNMLPGSSTTMYGTYEFDGIKLLKSNVDAYGGPEKVVELLNEITRSNSGMALRWKVKPIINNLNIPVCSDDEDIEIKDEYQLWKQEWEKTTCLIRTMAAYVKTIYVGNNPRLYYFKKHELITAYPKYISVVENGRSRSINCVQKWTEDEHLRAYQEIEVIPPPLHCPDSTFNLWKESPLSLSPILPHDLDYDKDSLDLFLEHCRLLFGEQYEWVLSWIAQSIQEPAEKCGFMLNLVGKQGCGKGTFVEILKHMYGMHTVETTCPERDVFGNFNGCMATSYLVVLDEVDKRNLYGKDGNLKGITTQGTLKINEKGVKPYDVVSYHRFILQTNSVDPINTSADDRRNVIIQCGSARKGDIEYFNRLHAIKKNETALRSIYWFFKSRDISDWDRKAPKTEYHKHLTENSRSPCDMFFEQFAVENRNASGSLTISASTLYQNYMAFKANESYSSQYVDTQKAFYNEMLALGLFDGIITRTRKTTGYVYSVSIDALVKKYHSCIVQLDESDLVDDLVDER